MAFDYAKAYQQFIDEELVAASVTAWMLPEAGKVRFSGGRDVEISTLSTSGLGNYDATKSDGSAYPSGTVSNDWTTYTLSLDRDVKFALDRTDPNDTHFLAAANGTYHSLTFGAGVSINGVTYDNVMLLDDLPCIFVPQSRMKTVITAQTGSGNSGGIVSASGAQDINVLLAHCSAPLAVSKLDPIKQFGPEENQFFDGTAIQARYLYDLFVPTKSVVSLGAIVEPAQAAGGN